MSLYGQAVAAERAAKIARDMAEHEAGLAALRDENAELRAALYDEQHGISFSMRDARIQQLESALRLMMACAGEINTATAAELECALECGDAETERQANAWLVARAALTPNVKSAP